ncbi:hypothetical protein [Curtobacterium sp. MCBA15_007]|uniref:hypothetical protein n=1 Tax=Curtobacterium sp. MCBA15_007 TaxID=1898735 RepID=UPI00111459A7|nr:hypothetical protein [Curtobacterium sp. MCBA15_007]
MTDHWRPLGAMDDDENLDGPHEGVPTWLEHSLWDWIDGFFSVTEWSGTYQFDNFNAELARRVERMCRVSIPYSGSEGSLGRLAVHRSFVEESLRLRLVDYLLAFEATPDEQNQLNLILYEAGSVWTTGARSGSQGLLRRVDESLADAVSEAVRQGHAGQRLAKAWNSAFGLHPNPSMAYSLAIKAIEDAAKPVVTPNDAGATLGRINGQISADPRWTLPFQRADSRYTSNDALAAILRTIWAGQVDRHGGDVEPGEQEPVAVTPGAAEATVVLAVAIVHLFTTGAVAKAG